VAVAALARFSLERARGDHDGARHTLTNALETTFFLVIPAAVGLYLLADPLVALCFERGAFTPHDTAATAEILRGYAFAVAGICATRVLLPIFFAIGDPYTPMKLSLVVMAMKIPVALALMKAVGLIGLPLSHAVTVSLEAVVMLAVLHRRLGGLVTGFPTEMFRVALASGVMGAVVFGLDGLVPGGGGFRVVGLCCAGAVAYAICAAGLKIRAFAPLMEKLQRRLRPPRSQP
jgi:putative peptidoglycan lipid II flippase